MTARRDIADAGRVVVKVGSSSLTTDSFDLDASRIGMLAEVSCAAARQGREIVVVTSGAIAASLGVLGLRRPPTDLATAQAAASVGQQRLIAEYARAFATFGRSTGQVLLTADDLMRRAHYRNAQRTLTRLLELDVTPIVNENDTVATDEIRFGDNDRLAALVAHLVHADALILLSDVPGLLTAPPGTPGSVLVTEVRDPADLENVELSPRSRSAVGTGGMVTKLESARLATAAGVPAVLADVSALAEVLAGEERGTLFHVTGKRRPGRLLWLAHAALSRGSLVLDDGAVAAVTTGKKSLLPAGICSVSGDFVAGDPVDLLSENGLVVARGLVNFDATELPGLLGRSTKDLAAELGPAYEREVIHRDDLVVMQKGQ
ncbi:MAG: glutamate 5-kinase [Actinobacteria bacterium]|nr:glutamate 5-kinase [Actinomycetota bacterium]